MYQIIILRSLSGFWGLLECKLTFPIGSFRFSFISGVSGTSLFNSFSLMAYNVAYTSIPVMVTSLLDKDLSERTVMQHPEILYFAQAGRYSFDDS